MNAGTVIALIKALGGSGGGGSSANSAPAIVGSVNTPADAVTITDGAGGKAPKSLLAAVTPVQSGSGTPAPGNVRPITGWTGATIKVSGKNLIDQATAEVYPRFFNSSDKWAISDAGGKSFAFPCEENVTYTVSIQGTTTTFRVGYIKTAIPTSDSTKPSLYDITRTDGGPGSVTITPGSGATYIIVQIGGIVIRTSDLQIEYGPLATAYEPYAEKEFTFDWSGIAGTLYGGTFDAACRKLTVTHVNIASYAGEEINEPWISSMDEYTEGGTPTTGAQVVYPLTEPVEYTIPGPQVTMLTGVNRISADCGQIKSVAYAADTKIYVDAATDPSRGIASANITSGDYFMDGNKLYIATATIASGDVLVPGTNCTAVTIAEALNTINS